MLQDLETTRLLAISPHLDDAALSIGAGLAEAAQGGAQVTVYTAFAGTASPPYSPAAERMHTLWGLSSDDDAPQYRRQEDIAALDHLGVDHRHGRFLDSIYRRLPDGQWLTDRAPGRQKLAINRRSTDSDRELVAEIVGEIGPIVDELDPTLIVTCAAVGEHPDHEAARDAALFVARDKNIPIRLWEDLPYATFGSDVGELPAGLRLGAPDVEAVGPEAWTRKLEAVKCYPSQLLVLHGPDKDLFAVLTDHAREISPHGGHGERTWSVLHDDARPAQV